MDGDDLGGLVEQQAPLGLRVVVTRLAEVLVLAADALDGGELADGPRQRLQLWFGVWRHWRRERDKSNFQRGKKILFQTFVWQRPYPCIILTVFSLY